jgi:CheY-like chemotaxis protein
MKAGSKIIIVDDNEEFRLILRTVLERKGFVVTEASDGQEAIERMSTDPFRLAIVDLDMPRMNGIELTRRVKKDHPGVPVMMITAYASFYAPGEILAAGVDAFLQKPVDFARLTQAIENL